ncbi:guanylate kinase [Thermophagus xiamenensis]|uniref:Guanylate kinase n=1 Tax=Thermophagus xiamenensis TaxID=385682 RepID=A0A1I2BJX0_9BACT|nr:guanylate kinase [Thermophagus xiamenensis]SFE56456.1 guanylate kinase [Thermophagus xiamenensis]
MAGKVIIFSAPSGSGKTTIIQTLIKKVPDLSFSISATNRPPRKNEKNGVDYYFIPTEQFRKKINNGEFLEWEEVYKGTYYGTLKSEIDRINQNGKVALLDVDVVGGTNIKKSYGSDALAIFIKPPSLQELEKRLRNRNTDSEAIIQKRLAKAEKELGYARFFDQIIVNNQLEEACHEAELLVKNFISQ